MKLSMEVPASFTLIVLILCTLRAAACDESREFEFLFDKHKALCENAKVLIRGDGIGATSPNLHWSLSRLSFEQENQPPCNSTEALLHALASGRRVWLNPAMEGLPKTIENGFQLAIEQSRFVPNGCSIPYMSANRACSILSKFSHIVTIGDSLMRHLKMGLAMILSENFYHGGLPHGGTPTAVYSNCTCDGQFSEHAICRVGSVEFHDPRALGVCSTVQPFFIQNGYRGGIFQGPYENYLNGELCDGDPRPRIFYLEGGLHFGVNATRMIGTLQAELQAIQSFSQNCTKPFSLKLIWSGVNTQSRKLDDKYTRQTREHSKQFNEETNSFMRSKGASILDFMNLTEEAQVSDGLHYLSDVNLFKATALLNLLEKL